MPPKKDVAAKGAKGKAKAVAKEEKKQQKVAKTQPKGKLHAHIFGTHLSDPSLYFMCLNIENLWNKEWEMRLMRSEWV